MRVNRVGHLRPQRLGKVQPAQQKGYDYDALQRIFTKLIRPLKLIDFLPGRFLHGRRRTVNKRYTWGNNGSKGVRAQAVISSSGCWWPPYLLKTGRTKPGRGVGRFGARFGPFLAGDGIEGRGKAGGPPTRYCVSPSSSKNKNFTNHRVFLGERKGGVKCKVGGRGPVWNVRRLAPSAIAHKPGVVFQPATG